MGHLFGPESRTIIYHQLASASEIAVCPQSPIRFPTQIFINRTASPDHWLMLELVGGKSNRDGLGARIKMTPACGATKYHQVFTAAGYGSSTDKRVHFGLGSATHVRVLEVRWPSGTLQTIRDVPVDQILVVTESE